MPISASQSYSEYSKKLFNELFIRLVDCFPSEINSTYEPVAKLFRTMVHYITQEQVDIIEITTIFALIEQINTPDHEMIYQQIQEQCFKYMATKGTMGQNKLQMICHHKEQDVTLLKPIIDVLTTERCAELFLQHNAKGWNVITTILYYCDNRTLKALLPCTQNLQSSTLKELLMQQLSYTTLPRYAAYAKLPMLPDLMTLMGRLDSADLKELIEARDHHDFTLLHYVTFYCPQYLKKLLQLVETLEPQHIVSLLNTVNLNKMTLFQSARLTNDPKVLACLLKTVDKLEEPFRSEVLDAQKIQKHTTRSQAASSSSFGVFPPKNPHNEELILDGKSPFPK